MRLSTQLLIAMSVSTVIAIGATNFAAINTASSSLESAAEEKLSAIADGKRNQLEIYFQAFDKSLTDLGKSSMAQAALNMYGVGLDSVGDGARDKINAYFDVGDDRQSQLLYHKENQTFRYFSQYEESGQFINSFVQENALDDFYLVNQEGLVVYANGFGEQLATNLFDGPQKDTHLGKFFNQLMTNTEKGTATFGAFDTYALMDGKSVAFAGAPIVSVENELFFGFLIAPISQTTIAKILDNNTGLGETGETVLIKPDGLLISDSTKTDVNDKLTTKLDLASVADVTGRDVSVGQLSGYRDINSIIALANVSFDNLDWQVAAISDRNEALAGASSMKVLVLSITALVILGSLAFAFWFARGITRPINAAIGNMNELSQGNTEFDQSDLDRKDEVGDIARAIEHFRESALEKVRLEEETLANRSQSEKERATNEAAKLAQAEAVSDTVEELAKGLEALASGDLASTLDKPFMKDMEPVRQNFNASVAKLRETLAGISHAAGTIRSDSNEISAATNDLSSRTETQAASLEEAAAALSELTKNVRSASEQANEVAQLAQSAKTDTDRSSDVVSSAMSAMGRIETASTDIGGIINVIDEIAFQTNLLALNAGVEAARAGEAGKGFAVVAQEVRELAGRSSDAAKEIKQLINTSNNEVDEGVKLVKATGEVLEQISDQVANIETRITTIAEGSKEQLGGIETVNDTVNAMDQRIQQNAAMAEETTAATMRLAEEINSLSGMVQTFRIDASSDQSDTYVQHQEYSQAS